MSLNKVTDHAGQADYTTPATMAAASFKPASEGRRTSTTTPTGTSSLQSLGASGEAERDGCQPPAAPSFGVIYSR